MSWISPNRRICKPNLFIVGAPKCGTTSMHNYLSQHPEIFMSYFKEPHYFGVDLTRRNKMYLRTEKSYLKMFLHAGEKKIIGESSAYYLYSKTACEEIYRFNPESKIIIMLRNPVDILYAMHAQYLFSGNETEPDFTKALALENYRMKHPESTNSTDILQKVFYKNYIFRLPGQIEKFQHIFGEDRVYIIFFEDLKSNLRGVYKGLLNFLQIDNGFTPDFTIVNRNKSFRSKFFRDVIKTLSPTLGALRGVISLKPLGIMKFIEKKNTIFHERTPLSKVLREELSREFEPVVDKLEILLEKDLGSWRV